MAVVPTVAIKGLQVGILGSPTRLGIAAASSDGDDSMTPFTDAQRVGLYFDRTPGQEKAAWIVGGQQGPTMRRNGSNVDMDVSGALTVDGVPVATGGGFSTTNKDADPILAGQPVTVDPSGSGVFLASAASSAAPACGLAAADASPLAALTVKTSGLVTLADWSAVTGSPALTPRAMYYLDPVIAGRITLVPPTTSGQIVQPIGIALTAHILDLAPAAYILL